MHTEPPNQTPPTTPQDPVREYLSRIGRKGGSAGRGRVKARTPEQARAAAKARWKKTRARRRMERSKPPGPATTPGAAAPAAH